MSMPPSEAREIGRELKKTIADINTQLEEVKTTSERMDIDMSSLVDERGVSLITPLLVAKATALHALTLVKSG